MPFLKIEKDNYIIAEESPTGDRIDGPDVFEATGSWYRKREGCKFLSPLTADEFRAHAGIDGPKEEAEVEDEEKEPDIELDEDGLPTDYQELKALAKETATRREEELESFKAADLREYLLFVRELKAEDE